LGFAALALGPGVAWELLGEITNALRVVADAVRERARLLASVARGRATPGVLRTVRWQRHALDVRCGRRILAVGRRDRHFPPPAPSRCRQVLLLWACASAVRVCGGRGPFPFADLPGTPDDTRPGERGHEPLHRPPPKLAPSAALEALQSQQRCVASRHDAFAL